MEYAILPVTPFEQNCSLLWQAETRRAAVVDPGGDVEEILAAIAVRDLAVEKILLTHGHIDHVGGAAALARELSVPIEGPQREDAFWLDALPEQCRMFGFPPTPPLVPDRWLGDGDVVKVGDLALEVLHTPGHTPGHVCFIQRPSRLAIVGDVLFAGSIGRTDFPRGDHAALIHSIRAKLFALGDDYVFIPGHGPLSTFGAERRSNPFVAD
ncbi:MBL fold metallo-hydrolase [Sulfuricystis multivorans]|uniref:MBL fold metallo-hydrolase n=1 Tax=Sulfuricystis multivorans TaxID=2211108 RepID=UPI000F83716F|nr:MBL fold metallo-hydrolase [Sulfuricystis multivorans]